jgi:uncharacterized protein YqjF (DUF2071 family)
VTGREPDSRVRLPWLRQAWREVTFVHWRYPRSVLQPLVPPGLTVQECDGTAWVTLLPFRMQDVRLAGTPPLPGLSTFPETNLRTYVLGPDGRAGLWFFSLDVASTWLAIGARLMLGAPYFRAWLAIDVAAGRRYAGIRAGRPRVRYRLRAEPGEVLAPSELDVWLTHRWRAYTRHAGTLVETPVRHEPWPLRGAAVTALTETLTTAAGLPAPGAPALAHYSEGVTDVAFGPPLLPALTAGRTPAVRGAAAGR